MSSLLALALALAVGAAPPPAPGADAPWVEYHLGDVVCVTHPNVQGLLCTEGVDPPTLPPRRPSAQPPGD